MADRNALSEKDAVAKVADELLSTFRNERQKLDRIDRWARWDHDDPHSPRQATQEHTELAARAQAPWGDLVVRSVAQTLYIEGYSRPDTPENLNGWRIWDANKMSGRQVALHIAALTYGLSYGTCLPGLSPLTGEAMPVMRARSPREMLAVYDDPADDDWPQFAIREQKIDSEHTRVWLFDAEVVHQMIIENNDAPEYETSIRHGLAVPPVVRYKNRFDLEGRSAGEIEPFIPVLGKIDQTSYDRLVVQRFASWVVRTVSGMVQPDSETEAAAAKLKLRVEDLLVADDPDTKFGTLPATPLDGFIKAHEADLQTLAAVSQTPAFELLGQIANLSADALEAARASQAAKSDERRHTLGEDHGQFIRLACYMAGDVEGASDFTAAVRWKDTSVRSLAQAADALGKMADQLGIPVQVLWKRIPGFTQQDIDEAKALLPTTDVLAMWMDVERQMQADPAAA